MSEEYLKLKQLLESRENKSCDTCYFKETRGDMVDPCFPCAMDEDNNPYSNWLPDTWTSEQVENYYNLQSEYLDHIFDNDPTYQKMVDEIVEILKNRNNVQ